MKTLHLDTPIDIDGNSIVEFAVTPLNFAAFVKLAEEATNVGNTTSAVTLNLSRLRMQRQIICRTAAGDEHKLTALSLMTLPAMYGKQLYNLLSANDSVPGELLNKGDGITTAVLYKLGTPLKSADETEITELEFLGKTYGDIEEVLVETQQLTQALALIKNCATPVMNNDKKFQVLPSWAVDSLSLADGLQIMSVVLPNFIE